MPQHKTFQVQKIVDSRYNSKGKIEYYIKWLGYGSEFNTWQPEKNLKNAQEALQQYKDMIQSKKKAAGSETIVIDDASVQEMRMKGVKSEEEGVGGQGDDGSQAKAENKQQLIKRQKQELDKKLKEPKKTKSIKKQPKGKPAIQILGVVRNMQTGFLSYYVLINEERRVVERDFFDPDYLRQLVSFYEANIVLY